MPEDGLKAGFLDNQVLDPLRYEQVLAKNLLKCLGYDQAVSEKRNRL